MDTPLTQTLSMAPKSVEDLGEGKNATPPQTEVFFWEIKSTPPP